jgi:Ca-activated chloride channel family protein
MGLLFLVPPWWPALLALPLLLWLGHRLSRRALQRTRSLLGRREEALCAPYRGRMRAACAVAAVSFAALALLQPVFGEGDGEPPGPEVVLCVDVSRSMAARDVAPTRLGAAQQQIDELAHAAAGTRLGLVAFAGDARLVAPLTADLDAVAVLARDLAAGSERRGGTNIGAAIEVGLRALARAGKPGRGSLVVLTDGEDFAGKATAAATLARAQGVPVYCVGFGAEGGSKIVVESETGESFLRDASGHEIVTRLDADGLRAVARAGGGQFALGNHAGALTSLHQTVLEPAARSAATFEPERQVAHRFQWPLCLSLLFCMLRWCLPERLR